MSLILFPVKPFKAWTMIIALLFFLSVSLPLDPTRFPHPTY